MENQNNFNLKELIELLTGAHNQIRLELRKDLPVTFTGARGIRRFSGLPLASLCSPEDLRFVAEELDRLTAGKGKRSVSVHFRVGDGQEHRWMLLTGELVKDKLGLRAAYLQGGLLDVTNYLEASQNDPALRDFRARSTQQQSDGNTLEQILGKEYLARIQAPFKQKGLVSAIFASNGTFLAGSSRDAADINEPGDSARYSQTKRINLRIAREEAGYWVLAGNDYPSFAQAGENMELLASVTAQLANAYWMLNTEMSNAAAANRRLGENIEHSVLMNELYYIALNNRPIEALPASLKSVGEYMNLSRILIYEYNDGETRFDLRFQWFKRARPNPPLPDFSKQDFPELFEQLEFSDTYFPITEKHELAGSGVKSFFAVNLSQGDTGGIIFFEYMEEFHIPEPKETKILRDAAHLLSGELARLNLDMSLEKATERYRRLAYNDSVLGIFSRARLERDLSGLLKKGGNGAAIAVKITNMRVYSELFGHSYTDELLCTVAQYINGMLLGERSLYSFSGNMFFIILKDTDTGEAGVFVKSMLQRFSRAWIYSGHEHFLEAGAGIAIFPHHGDKTEVIYRNATLAMYQAIRQGPNAQVVYNVEMSPGYGTKQLELVNTLTKEGGLRNITVLFQPEITMDSEGKRIIAGAEAFADFRNTNRRLLFDIAAALGFDHAIDSIVIDKACELCAQVRKRIPEFTVSVNVTVHELRSGIAAQMIAAALKKWKLPANAVFVEISTIDAEGCVDAITALKELGVRITLDSFQSEEDDARLHPGELFNTNLFDRMKIDAGRMTNPSENPFAYHMTTAAINIGRSLPSGLVIKKVEDVSILEHLQRENRQRSGLDPRCPVGAQGTAIGPLMNSVDFITKSI